MRIAQINAVCGSGSTGKICISFSKLLNERNIENRIYYTQGCSSVPQGVKYSDEKYKKIQALQSRVFGNWGFNSNGATEKLIKYLDEFKPDRVLVHNIHAHDCNIQTLFEYLQENKIKVFWLFHDCWAFTAYCTHFMYEKCTKWENGCEKCPKFREASWFTDRSQYLYAQKKKLFTSVDLTVITPSRWMAENVKQSFLKEKPVYVIHNGIDLEVFRPTIGGFREKYGLDDRFVILGVSSLWTEKKGVDVFVRLSEALDPRYQIVLVGTDRRTDRQLPPGVISIHRMTDAESLAQIYSAADVFVNPTREDNYPTVNLEAIACGTPVITFDTGGCRETVPDGCGIILGDCSTDELTNAIKKVESERQQFKSACIRARERLSDKLRYEEVIELLCKKEA